MSVVYDTLNLPVSFSLDGLIANQGFGAPSRSTITQQQSDKGAWVISLRELAIVQKLHTVACGTQSRPPRSPSFIIWEPLATPGNTRKRAHARRSHTHNLWITKERGVESHYIWTNYRPDFISIQLRDTQSIMGACWLWCSTFGSSQCNNVPVVDRRTLPFIPAGEGRVFWGGSTDCTCITNSNLYRRLDIRSEWLLHFS